MSRTNINVNVSKVIKVDYIDIFDRPNYTVIV